MNKIPALVLLASSCLSAPLRAQAADPVASTDDPAEAAPAPPSMTPVDVWSSGKGEAMIHGTLAGGTAGFLLAATGFSTARTSERDSLGWLIAAPAAGAVAGALGASALVGATAASPGDIALVSSTLWMGTVQGLTLQLALFEDAREATAASWRFATVLGGGALGLASGLGLASVVEMSPGDVAVANSAGLWGGVLTTLALQSWGNAVGGISVPSAALAIGGGALIPWATAIALHPFIDVDRSASWLIEAGGAAGFLVGSGLAAAASSGLPMDGSATVAIIGGATAAGVTMGGVAAVALSAAARKEPSPAAAEDTSSRSMVASLFTSGKAELLAATTLSGGALALSVYSGLVRSTESISVDPSLMLLTPVGGGALGLAAGAAAAFLWPQMTAGDALVIRSSLMLGGFDAIAASVLLDNITTTGREGHVPLAAAGILTASGLLGGALAAATDLPEGASALAVSGALWTSVVGLLGTQMFETVKASTQPTQDMSVLLLTTANIGFAGGMALGTFVPVTRAETWALDAGGAVGFLAGAALAVNGRAPNPFLGWGSMAAGSVVGMGAGFAAARFLPGWLASLDEGASVTLRWAPALLPGTATAGSAAIPALTVHGAW